MSARQWVQLASEVVGYAVVAGPTGALAMLLWIRDIEAIDAEVHQIGVKKTSQRSRLKEDLRMFVRSKIYKGCFRF